LLEFRGKRRNDSVNEQETILAIKKSISLTSALSMLALMVVSCSSQPKTTTTTTRQTTTTTANAADNRPPVPIGYRDNNMENNYGGIPSIGR
jgi:hypothetical protein